MKPFEVFVKTMKFCWLKLACKAANFVISILTFLLLVMLIGTRVGGAGLAVCIILWVLLIRVTDFLINKYFGYLIRAGHIAVVVKAFTAGELPTDQFAYATETVKRRFAVTNVFFVIDRLVDRAVRQIQRMVNTVGILIAKLPGGKQIMQFVNLFIEVAFGSVDECVLGWVFYKEELGAFHGACDGIVLFFQNFKALMLRALKTTAIIMGVMALIVIVPVLIAFGSNDILAIVITLYVTVALCNMIKVSFIDSYIFIAMMGRYLELATEQVPSISLYDKCCKWSNKFRELVSKRNEEGAAAPAYAYINNNENQ